MPSEPGVGDTLLESLDLLSTNQIVDLARERPPADLVMNEFLSAISASDLFGSMCAEACFTMEDEIRQ